MTLNPFSPLMEDEVRELAGCLLTSSTIERYLRCIEASQAVANLTNKLDIAPDSGTELLKYAWFYWTQLLETRTRSEWEIPLAALVYVLADSGTQNAEKLLTACAVSSRPQAAWVAGLARRLLATRRAASTFTMFPARLLQTLPSFSLNTASTKDDTVIDRPKPSHVPWNASSTVDDARIGRMVRAA